MTVLMVDQRHDGVIIITDTLVSGPNGEAKFYTPKIWTLPELNVAMVATGALEVFVEWFARMKKLANARDVEDLDRATPGELRKIYDELTESRQIDLGRCTIHLFGFPLGDDKIVRYTYRLSSGFESERYAEPTYFINPPALNFTAEIPENLEESIALATKLRDEGRVPIGGELAAVIVTNGQVSGEIIHRFPDYDETLPVKQDS